MFADPLRRAFLTSPLQDQLQTTLGASYSIERELGGGGMSRVFVARDATLDREVVVKVLPPEMAGAMSADRFRREIQVAARLQHPHIVPLLSAGHAGDLLYFTMPFVSGESLRTRLVRGELPITEAVRILRDVADALAYAHKHGVARRDIKPENVLLSEGHALVTDFGVAKALSAASTGEHGTAPNATGGATSIGVAVGTPAYMAPEQAAADPTADHRVDIYAFGVLAYELLVGEPPFRGRTAQETIAAHMTQAPDPVSRRRPSVPESLAALVMRCLEKRPADRPQNATELVNVLESAHTPGGHVPGYTSSGTLAPARARSWKSWAIGAALLAVLGGVALAWRARERAGTPDARLVVVLPFRVAGADPSLHYLREGMVDLLAAKLTGLTRVADPRSVLAACHSAGGTETADVDQDAALRIARRLGAREVLLGDVTGAKGTVVLHASLVSTDGGEPRTASVEGMQDSVTVLVDRLAVQLLALRSGQDIRTLGSISATPLAAIRDYLDGQALARRGKYVDALAKFNGAVRADSNFAVAWYGRYDMEGWLSGASDSSSRALSRLMDRLPPATRAVAEARVGLHYPIIPTSAEHRTLAERATTIAPDNAAAWQFLGEVYYHYAPAMGVTDSKERARAAFERVIALDSSATMAWEHLPDLEYQLGDTAAMRRSLSFLFTQDTSGRTIAYFLSDAVLGDRNAAMTWRAIASRNTGKLGNIIQLGADLGLSLRAPDSLSTLAATRAVTDQERVGATMSLLFLATVRGQPARGARLVRSSSDLFQRTPIAAPRAMLDALFADADTTLAVEARSVVEAQLQSDSSLYSFTWFTAALHDLSRGDTASAQRQVRRLRAAPEAECGSRIRAYCKALALVLDAQLAAVQGRTDARVLRVSLDSMLKEGISGSISQVGNLVVARLWERAGDNGRALAAIRRRLHFIGRNPLIATYYREEGRLAAAAGDRVGSVRAYRRYLTLREDAEPSLARHLADVRAEVAKLERQQERR